MSFWFAISSYISVVFTLGASLVMIAMRYYFNWGIQNYKGLKVEKFMKQIKYSSHSSNGKHTGLCLGFGSSSYNGYNFIGYISESIDQKPVFNGLCNSKMLDGNEPNPFAAVEEVKHAKEEEKEESKGRIYHREGGFGWFEYTQRDYHHRVLEPKASQKYIVEQICSHYKATEDLHRVGCSVSFIHGEPGTGKSMIGEFLVQELLKVHKEVHFVDCFNPVDAGDPFAKMYTGIGPTKDSPLVVLLDEVDIIIENIHYQRILPHKAHVREIYDKVTWNKFFDNFDRLRFPFVYLVMTSNRTERFINELDASYIRNGRVGLKVAL